MRFGTPLNKKFGTSVVAKDLGIPGGYRPGSNVSRQLIAFSNMYWAKQIAPSVGGLGRPVSVLSAEPVVFSEIKKSGVNSIGPIVTGGSGGGGVQKGAVIAVNPGGEETWERLLSRFGSPSAPFVVLNNAYSTTYDLGNKRGYEEAYYLKRISKGWVFRQFPGVSNCMVPYRTTTVCPWPCQDMVVSSHNNLSRLLRTGRPILNARTDL